MASPKAQKQLQSVKNPSKVKVIILADNHTTIREFYVISSYTNLVKIDLSYNKLTTFPPGFSFQSYLHLRSLFLHYNKFTALRNLGGVAESKSIVYLTLFGNPLEEAKVRHYFVNQMTSLQLMDDKIVRLQERQPALSLKQKKIDPMPFPLVPVSANQQPQGFIYNVIKQLTIVRLHYLRANPIIKIQRWWRHKCRLRHRKWKVVELPKLQQIQQASPFRHQKKQIERLLTEKMQIHSSNEQKIFALIKGNFEMWNTFKHFFGGQIYLSAQFCQKNSIEFSEESSMVVIKQQHQVSYHGLSFFIHYHQAITKITKISTQLSVLFAELNFNSWLIKKFPEKQQKINKIYQKYNRNMQKYIKYVKPAIQYVKILQLIKHIYFTNKTIIAAQVLIPKLAQRPLAALKIQSFYRGYRVRCNFNARKQVRKVIAARKLQRWVRGLKFFHRHKFLLEVSHYLRHQNNSFLLLEMSQMIAIQAYINYKQNYGLNLVIPFQKLQFAIDQRPLNFSIAVQAERKPDPKYLNLNIKLTKPSYQKDPLLLDFLFKGVEDVQKMKNAQGIDLVRLVYRSVEQARTRKFVLALKTYRMGRHQFVRSISSTVTGGRSLLQDINDNKIVQMIYQKKKEAAQQIRILQSKRSQSSLNTDMGFNGETLCVRIKFYMGPIDYSCLLLAKSSNISLKLNANLIRDSSFDGGKYFLKKGISNRYNLGYQAHGQENTHSNSKVSISRNIISLHNSETQKLHSLSKPVNRYPRILNTDQSHMALDSLPSQRSLNKLGARLESWDKFDRQVYPQSQTESIRGDFSYRKELEQQDKIIKKQKIAYLRMSHQQKLQEIASKRAQSLNRLRQQAQIAKEAIGHKMIQCRKEINQINAQKTRQIRQRFKSKDFSFQQQFLKKGIKSIKRELVSFQKSKSFRGPVAQKSQKTKKLTENLKVSLSDIKSFQMSLSDQKVMDSAQLRQGRTRQMLKKQINRYKSRQSIAKSEQDQRGSSHFGRHSSRRDTMLNLLDSQIELNPNYGMASITPNQQQKLRKKRMVHSVFPEQFYPLKKSGQIGFQLPRIGK